MLKFRPATVMEKIKEYCKPEPFSVYGQKTTHFQANVLWDGLYETVPAVRSARETVHV